MSICSIFSINDLHQAFFSKKFYCLTMAMVENILGIFTTPHLNGKKLSTNSPWDFEYVFVTMDDYWVDADENFCPESTRTRWRCNHFSQKWPKSKIKKNLLNKNLLLPLTFGVEIFLRCTIFEFGFFCLQKLTNIWYEKQKMLKNDVFEKDDWKPTLGSFIDKF